MTGPWREQKKIDGWSSSREFPMEKESFQENGDEVEDGKRTRSPCKMEWLKGIFKEIQKPEQHAGTDQSINQSVTRCLFLLLHIKLFQASLQLIILVNLERNFNSASWARTIQLIEK